jgi:DNA polymerase I-like protein with 3'-5' exonuclease and polymerase domains
VRNWIAFDLETSGTRDEYALQPWRVKQGFAWITSFATCEEVSKSLTFTGGIEPDRKTLKQFLMTSIIKKQRIVTWNGTFDASWLIAYGLEGLVMEAKWLDGMRLWRHYFIEPEWDMNRANKKHYGLKTCVDEVLPWLNGYQDDIDLHDPDPAVRAKLLQYNKDDTQATLLCADHWFNLLTPQQRRCAMIEADMIPHIARANLEGMVIDQAQVCHNTVRMERVAMDMMEQLAPHGVTEAMVKSPKQLALLLYDTWRLPVLKVTKTGNESTDKECLHELAFIDPRAKLIRNWREALNLGSKFCQSMNTSALYNQDGRSHPEAVLFGTYSGRLTYGSNQTNRKSKPQVTVQTGFALHQMKRDAEFRASVVPPEDHVLMEFDAAGQEFKWMAVAAEDETMLRLCAPGEDAHTYMASEIAEVDYRTMMLAVKAGDKVAKERRQLGKVGNLSLQYRTSARKLRTVARLPPYEIPIELPEAQRIHKTYQLTYPGVPVYWRVQISRTKRLGYVETFAGRRVQVVGNWDGPQSWAMGSTSINYRIQGTGADQKYLAISVLSPYLTAHGIHFAWDMHDGLYFYVPTPMVERAAVEMKAILDNLPYERAWGLKPPIAMPWDCKAGPSWGGLKEWKYD